MILNIVGSVLNSLFFFALHIDSKNVFPKPLSKQEEEECFKKMQEGDESARNKLIEHNLRLVAHIIKKYYSNLKDQDELISIGTIGLIKAVSTFDYLKGNRFDIYIDDPIDTDKDGNALTLMDIMGDGKDIVEQVDLSIRSGQLYGFLENTLDDREFEIIKHRYGLYGCNALTQREVAQKLNISRSYVSRIEKKALSSLRKMYEKNPY